MRNLHPVWKAFIKNTERCQEFVKITGKRAMGGNHVSHSKRRVKRTFSINLFKRNFYWPEEDRWIRLNVSADGLRLINKRGLNACLKDATAAGLIKTI